MPPKFDPNSDESNHPFEFPLRIIVLTAGELSHSKQIFLGKLASDPLLEVCGIVVDGLQPKQKRLSVRLYRGIAKNGMGWLFFKIKKKLLGLCQRVVLRCYDRLHGGTLEPVF